jgi:hypothetical protein
MPMNLAYRRIQCPIDNDESSTERAVVVPKKKKQRVSEKESVETPHQNSRIPKDGSIRVQVRSSYQTVFAHDEKNMLNIIYASSRGITSS